MLMNYDDYYYTYIVDGLIFKIKHQDSTCVNYPCPYCGQNTLRFLGMNDELLSWPPQYRINIACDNPCCPGRHNLSGIIINGEFNTDSGLAITSTIKKLINSRPLDKIVSSKDSMIKEQVEQKNNEL